MNTSAGQRGRLVILSAPSGTGKSTIISHIMQEHPELNLHFSVSATSRPPRGAEQHGVAYYFFTPEEFRQRIDAGDFIEWEEVYEGKYYGTLRSEVERRLDAGDNVILDIDCVGGVNVKRLYGAQALSLFILPPSLAELRRRLEHRSTDAPELIEERLAKAERELTYAASFDRRIVNDQLDRCIAETLAELRAFLLSD